MYNSFVKFSNDRLNFMVCANSIFRFLIGILDFNKYYYYSIQFMLLFQTKNYIILVIKIIITVYLYLIKIKPYIEIRIENG